MDIEERIKLKKQYESLPDFQLSQMLADGKDSYVEGAYELLQEEAWRRGLEAEKPAVPQEKIEKPQLLHPAEPEVDVNTYLQLIVINDESDRRIIDSRLSGAQIPYYFQNLHIRNQELPVGLMVDHLRFEDAIELLNDFKPANSIILW